MPSLVRLGLSLAWHRVDSPMITEGTLPTERAVMVDEGLKFAAVKKVHNRGVIGWLRENATNAVKLPKHKWMPVTVRSRKVQQEGIRRSPWHGTLGHSYSIHSQALTKLCL